MQIASDKKERKVPIIITGNDFSKIYYPLRRSGRMTSIYWEPSGEERLDSVQMLFPWIPINDCKKYIFELENFAKEIKTMRPPISFYSTIKSKIFDDVLWKQLLEERQKTMDTSYIDNLAYPSGKIFSVDEIIEKSKKELENIKKSNNSFVKGSEFDG